MLARSPTLRRLGLTGLAVVAVAVLARLPTPGLDLALAPLHWFDAGALGPLAFRLRPFIVAALVVELLAALVPRWRRLRHGEGRDQLLARSRQLCFLMASVQAFFVFRWLDSYHDDAMGPLLPEGIGARMVIAVAPVAGTMALVWLAGFIGRHGLGNGFSVLIATLELPEVARSLITSTQERLLSGDPVVAPLALSAMLVVALVASTARQPSRGWDARPPRPELLIPASSILAANLVETLYHFQDRLPDSGVIGELKAALEPGTLLDALVFPALVLALGLLCAWLFNRPAVVAAAWARVPGFRGDDLSALVAARVALRRGAGRALLFLGAMAAMTWYVDRAQVVVDVLWLTVIGCIAADVVAELRFRRRHPDLVSLAPLHQMYTVGPALHQLDNDQIPAFPRALRHGALLNFWGPYVPVEILVPRERAADAEVSLKQLLT